MRQLGKVINLMRIPFVLFLAFNLTMGTLFAQDAPGVEDITQQPAGEMTAPADGEPTESADIPGEGDTDEENSDVGEGEPTEPADNAGDGETFDTGDDVGDEGDLTGTDSVDQGDASTPSSGRMMTAANEPLDETSTVTVTYTKDRPDLPDFYLPTTAEFTLQGVTDNTFVQTLNASGSWPEVFVIEDVPDGEYTASITGIGQFFKDDASNNPARTIVVDGANVERSWVVKLGVRATLYPLQSTNEANIGLGYGHVIQQNSVCGEISLQFVSPTAQLFWTEVLVDGEPWNGFRGGPHQVVPDDIEYGGFGTNNSSQIRTYEASEVRVRFALGQPGAGYFDWTSFYSEPCVGNATINLTHNYPGVDIELPAESAWTITDRDTNEVVQQGVTGGEFPVTFGVENLPYGDYTFSLADLGPRFKSETSGGVSLLNKNFTVSGADVQVNLKLQLTAMGAWHPLRSTNEANIAANLPHVEVQDSVCGTVTLQFNNTNTGNNLFYTEVLVDEEPWNGFYGGAHQVVPDDVQYGGISTAAGESQTHTFEGNLVEVRFALGGPGEAYFDWTSFQSEPCVSEVTVSVSSADDEISTTLPVGSSWTVTQGEGTIANGTFGSENLELPATFVVGDSIPYGTYQLSVAAGPTFEPFANYEFVVDSDTTNLSVELQPVVEDSDPETSVPTEPVTPVPTEPVAPGTQALVITINLPGNVDIEGAPYSLYAPMAAQFMAEPYVQGTVGPNNTIEIDGLMAGPYRLVIEPVGMDPIDVMVTVGTGPVTEAAIQVDESGNATVVYAGQVPPATEPAAETPAAETPVAASSVTGLPETGAGFTGSLSMVMLATVAAALMGAGGLILRQKQ